MHNVTSSNAIVNVPSNYEATSSKCAIPNDAPVLSSDNNHQVNFKLPLCDKPSHRKSSSVHDNFISSVKRHKGLKVGHLNVRSLYNKYDEIMSILTQSQLGILCLNETWLDNTITNSQIHIPGYVIERRDRNRCGGGVSMYIREDIDYELRTDIASVNTLVESLWVEIKCINSMPCLISSIYRPPSARVDYYNGILDILDKASLENKDIILSADLNIDYVMDESFSSNPVHHIEILYGISQIVTKPTRDTDKSSTLIDVILTTMPELHSYTDVYEFALSDHFLVYTCVNSPIRKAKHKTVRYRCYKILKSTIFSTTLNFLAYVNALV